MPNGTGTDRGFALIDVALKIGPAACAIGGAGYAVAYILLTIDHPSLSGVAQVVFGATFGLAGYAAGKSLQRATTMYVSNEAEKRIENRQLANNSSVPQIQREIEKQQNVRQTR